MDARGAVPPVVMARYLEHVRWQALSGGLPGLDTLLSEQRRPVVRVQHMEGVQRFGVGTEVRITLHVARVGRTSLTFAHRCTRADGEPLGWAAAIVVVLGPDGAPTPVPDAVRELVSEEAPRVRVPACEEAPPPSAVRLPLLIRPSDLDIQQHVNQSNYVAFFDDAIQQAAGRGMSGLPSARPRLTAVTVDHRRELRVGQEVEVVVWGPEQHVVGLELRDGATRESICRGRAEVAG